MNDEDEGEPGGCLLVAFEGLVAPFGLVRCSRAANGC